MSSPISQCIPPLLTSGNHKFVFYIHDSKESISLYLFFFLVAPHSMQDLSSPTKDWTSIPWGESKEF